mgnify:CR=1 FL=1
MEKKDFFTKIHPILRALQPSPKKNFWDIPSFITEEKEEQINPSVSSRKQIIKTIVEINEIETNKALTKLILPPANSHAIIPQEEDI